MLWTYLVFSRLNFNTFIINMDERLDRNSFWINFGNVRTQNYDPRTAHAQWRLEFRDGKIGIRIERRSFVSRTALADGYFSLRKNRMLSALKRLMDFAFGHTIK